MSISIAAVYAWIAYTEPEITLARIVVRYLFLFLGGGGIALAFSYFASLVQRNINDK